MDALRNRPWLLSNVDTLYFTKLASALSVVVVEAGIVSMAGVVVVILPIPTEPILSEPCDCNFPRSELDSPFESEQAPPLGATAMLAKLLTTGPPVCTAIEI